MLLTAMCNAHSATGPVAGANNGAAARSGAKPCVDVTVDPVTSVTLGKSSVINLSRPVNRVLIGGRPGGRAGKPMDASAAPGGTPAAAPAASRQDVDDGIGAVEVTLLSPTELFFLGREAGTMNVVLQGSDGRCVVKDIVVTVDPSALQAQIADLMPDEKGIRVRGAENSLVLSGEVSDAIKLDGVLTLAAAYADGKRIVNMMSVRSPQQVMLEVKIAEVSKTILDKLGFDFTRIFTSADGLSSKVISGILGGGAGVVGKLTGAGAVTGSAIGAVSGATSSAAASVNTVGRGATLFGIDAENKDGLVRVLAEPNIMAVSGQQASFLSGGKIFIPVAQTRDAGGSVITLEEKQFGVGLKFTPTVLDGSKVNLKLVSEVSELSQTGSPFTTVNGVTSVLPSLSTRQIDTTVQLHDGQSFAVAGLIRNNVTETIRKFPGVGDVPILGALFRSSEFQKDQTELVFVITPRMVKPMTANVTLPTDNHVEPTPVDALIKGRTEGAAPVPEPEYHN